MKGPDLDPISLLQQWIKEYGLLAALVAFAGFNYVMIIRSQRKSENERLESETRAHEANTAQQNLITEQFRAMSEENRKLRLAIDEIEKQAKIAENERSKMAIELATYSRITNEQKREIEEAHQKALALEMEIKSLSEKVFTLESIRASQESELQRERTDSESLKVALRNANEQIVLLRERVSKLEGENKSLRDMFAKIEIISVASVQRPEADGAP